MKKGILQIITASTLLVSCTFLSTEFDRKVWLENNNADDKSNPRDRMTDDLKDNYLRPGMTKDSVLALLGTPYMDKIVMVPDGMETPDSLQIWNFTIEPKEAQLRRLKEYNDWHRNSLQPDTLLTYSVGWSGMDPKFLKIKFNNHGVVKEFRVEQIPSS